MSFAYKMAAKTSWHRFGTKLRHCHPMYKIYQNTPFPQTNSLSREEHSSTFTGQERSFSLPLPWLPLAIRLRLLPNLRSRTWATPLINLVSDLVSGKVMRSVVSVSPPVHPTWTTEFWPRLFVYAWVIDIARRGLKVKVIRQGQTSV